jgi:hypothetical protein
MDARRIDALDRALAAPLPFATSPDERRRQLPK